MGLRVREFRRRDSARFLGLLRASFPRELAVTGFDARTFRKQLRLYGFLKVVQRLFRRPFALLYVGEADGEVVAAVSINRERRAWYIGTVMVAPGHRRKGYGRAVLSFALERIRELGGKRAILHVLEDNLPAKRLYESVGFVRFEREVSLVQEPPEGDGETLPRGYALREIGLLDPRALGLSYAAMEPSSREVYGEPELPPWFVRPMVHLQPGVHERYAVVHRGRWVGLYTFVAPLLSRGASTAAISILPDHRGRGLEEALLSRAGARAGEIGCPRLITRANELNSPLLSACERLGFTRLYVMEGMYRDL